MSTNQEPEGTVRRAGYPGVPPRPDSDVRARDTIEAGGTLPGTDRQTVVQREKQQYGGIKGDRQSSGGWQRPAPACSSPRCSPGPALLSAASPPTGRGS